MKVDVTGKGMGANGGYGGSVTRGIRMYERALRHRSVCHRRIGAKRLLGATDGRAMAEGPVSEPCRPASKKQSP